MKNKVDPAVFAVTQRIEYRDPSQLSKFLRVSMDKKFGTYGVIKVGQYDGYFYQSVDTPQGASWWIGYYRDRASRYSSVEFIPAPDQHTQGAFVAPVFPEETWSGIDPVQWYLDQYGDEYTL